MSWSIKKHIWYKVLNNVLYVVPSILLARALGPISLGRMTIIATFCALATPLLDIGVSGNILWKLGKKDATAWYGACRILNLACALFVWGLLSIIWVATSGYSLVATTCFALYCCEQFIADKPRALKLLTKDLRARITSDNKVVVIITIAKCTAFLVLKDPKMLILSSFALGVFAAIVRNKLQDSYISRERWVVDRNKTFTLLKEGIVLLPSQLAQQAIRYSSNLWIGGFVGTQSLGDFTVAQKAKKPFTVANTIIFERYHKNPSVKRAIIVTAAAVLITLAGSLAIPLVYGGKYKMATIYCAFLTIPWATELIIGTLGLKILRGGDHKGFTLACLLGALTTLVANGLIKPLGVYGAILAITLGYLTQITTQVILVRTSKKMENNPDDNKE